MIQPDISLDQCETNKVNNFHDIEANECLSVQV